MTCDYFMRHPVYDRRGQEIASSRLTFPSYQPFRAKYADAANRSATMKRIMHLAELYETDMNQLSRPRQRVTAGE